MGVKPGSVEDAIAVVVEESQAQGTRTSKDESTATSNTNSPFRPGLETSPARRAGRPNLDLISSPTILPDNSASAVSESSYSP